MPLFEFIDLAIVQVFWLIFSGIWMLRRNDEIPLLISFLLFYITGYRYWAVTSGLNDWVSLSQFSIQAISSEQALNALSLLILSQSCFLFGYFQTQKRRIFPIDLKDPPYFLIWIKSKILLLGLLCLPLVLLVRANVASQVKQGQSLAFGVSGYLYQFPFVLVGIATLIMCLWKFGLLTKMTEKIIAILMIVGVAQLTFQTSGRFQLIGWLATTAIIFSSSYRPTRRIAILSLFLSVSASVFAIAGSLRGGTGAFPHIEALTRFIGAEDANMLDGFVLLQRYVPEITPYRWGMTHLEILLRPIPRALWPGKPIGGGYMADVGLSNASTGQTIGISPTLFGDFYSEGGWFVMIVLALVYGVALAKLVQWSSQLTPFASILIRSIICAALVPILRGGDLAGIVAWLGMAFWPCFVLLWFKRKTLLTPIRASALPWERSSASPLNS